MYCVSSELLTCCKISSPSSQVCRISRKYPEIFSEKYRPHSMHEGLNLVLQLKFRRTIRALRQPIGSLWAIKLFDSVSSARLGAGDTLGSWFHAPGRSMKPGFSSLHDKWACRGEVYCYGRGALFDRWVRRGCFGHIVLIF